MGSRLVLSDQVFMVIVIYLLSVMLIPLTIGAYALTYVIQAKDSDSMVRESHIMMRLCVKLAAPYFAICTVLLGVALLALQ